MTEYDFPFERVKHIKEQLNEMSTTDDKEEEEKVKEVTEEEAKKINDEGEAALLKGKGGKTIDLSGVKEGKDEEIVD